MDRTGSSMLHVISVCIWTSAIWLIKYSCPLSIKSQISPKSSRGKKGSTKRRHQRHHQRQPDENFFPYRVPPTSLTFNMYFYLYLYLYITRLRTNNGTPYLKSPKNQNRRAVLGRQQLNYWGLELVSVN